MEETKHGEGLYGQQCLECYDKKPRDGLVPRNINMDELKAESGATAVGAIAYKYLQVHICV